MKLSHSLLISLLLIGLASLLGCSDDDDPAAPVVPEEPRVETVVMAPAAATYNAIGEEIPFTALAFDQYDAVIDTVITWQTSDPEVVTVNENGITLATGLGSAEIYAMAGSAADTADVTVTLDGATANEWIAGGSGNWSDGGNWSGGEAPGEGEVAVISADGTYTVTLDGDVAVGGLVLGGGTGTQTLDTSTFNLRVTSGGLYDGGALAVQNEFTILGDVVWAGGDVDGDGMIAIMSSAELHVTANPLDVDANIDNSGSVVLYPGSSLRINESLQNNIGGLVELQGDAFLTVQFNGSFINSGSILKSLGTEEASIIVSSIDDSEFASTGPIQIESGTLAISGGSLRGHFDIAAGAVLRQSGTTELLSANMTGDGTLVVGGRVVLGTYASQVIDVAHLVLDSGSTPAITGEASLLVNRSFVWRQGMLGPLGGLTTQVHSQTSFEDGGTKSLVGTTWKATGNVHGDSAVDLDLRDGAVVSVEFHGGWYQSSGGEITQGVGDPGSFNVIGDFEKTGAGTFIVRTGLSCSGTMDLREGVVDVFGDFSLSDGGLITGGSDGTGQSGENLRLRVLNATSAVVRGTVEPDLDGEPAMFQIQGIVDLQPSAKIKLDVAIGGELGAESVHFVTSGQGFGGTLELAVARPVNPGEEFRVIHSVASQGTFEVVGGEQFTEIEQNSEGVFCRRN